MMPMILFFGLSWLLQPSICGRHLIEIFPMVCFVLASLAPIFGYLMILFLITSSGKEVVGPKVEELKLLCFRSQGLRAPRRSQFTEYWYPRYSRFSGMEQRPRRGRSRSRSRARSSSRAPSKVRVSVVEENGSRNRRGRSRSRSGSRLPRKGILKQSSNPVSAAVASNIRRRSRSRSRKRRGGTGVATTGETRHLQREVTALKRKTNGPKVSDTFKTTLTLGVVGGNTSPEFDIQRSMGVNLHPLLLKDATANNTSTPLTDRAKNYALWRCSSCSLRFMPFVNNSNVTGTLIVASVDMDMQASKPVSIDALLARPYFETGLGARGQWKIPAAALRGPEEGWWKVDTNDTATNTIGPGIDIHTYGATYNLLSIASKEKDQVITTNDLPMYTGPLCSVQMTVTFEFGNWEPKPGLGTLVQETISGDNVSFSTDNDQNLVMTPSETPSWARFNEITLAAEHHYSPHYHFPGLKAVAPSRGLGSTIWAVADTLTSAVSSALPGPWAWLIRGGYWFIRRVFGPSENADAPSYKVYASIEDAQRDVGCTNDAPISSPVPYPTQRVRLTQINSTNVQSPQQYLPTDFAPRPPAVEGEYPLGLLASMQYAPWLSNTRQNWAASGAGQIAFIANSVSVFTSPHDAESGKRLKVVVTLENPDTAKLYGAVIMQGLSDDYMRAYTPEPLSFPPYDLVRYQFIDWESASDGLGIYYATQGQQSALTNYANPIPEGTLHSLMKWAFDNPRGHSYAPWWKVSSEQATGNGIWALSYNESSTPVFRNFSSVLARWGWTVNDDLYALPGYIMSTWSYRKASEAGSRQPAVILCSRVKYKETGHSDFIVLSSYYPVISFGTFETTTTTPTFVYPKNPFVSETLYPQSAPVTQIFSETETQVFVVSDEFVEDTIPTPPRDEYPPETAMGANSAYVAELERRLAALELLTQQSMPPPPPNSEVDSDDDTSGSVVVVDPPSRGGCHFEIHPRATEGASPDIDEELLEQVRRFMLSKK
nr:MAG: capsid protein [Astroviridae sp.]